MPPAHSLHQLEDLGAFLGALRGAWVAQGPSRGTFVDGVQLVHVHWVDEPAMVRFFAPVQREIEGDLAGLCTRVCAVNARLNLGQFVLDASIGVLGFYSSVLLDRDRAVGSDVVATHVHTALAAGVRHREALLGELSEGLRASAGAPPWWAEE